MSIFVSGNKHGNIRDALSYRRNPKVRQLAEDNYGKHEVVCIYKDIFKLPDTPRDSNFQDWEFVCQTAQIV